MKTNYNSCIQAVRRVNIWRNIKQGNLTYVRRGARRQFHVPLKGPKVINNSLFLSHGFTT